MGEPSRAREITRPKCFRCGELGHWMADCNKGDKYGKGQRIDSGETFDEQGDKKKQEATFDNYGEVNKEFVTSHDGPFLMVRRVCFTPQKVKGDDRQRHNLFHSILLGFRLA